MNRAIFMQILVANIGTSDLAVKPLGIDYYLPIGFDRNEPNEDRQGLTTDELELWNNRDQYIELLCNELGEEVKKIAQGDKQFFQVSFRGLTKKILRAYRADLDVWDSRLCPGRIGGVLQEAREKHGVTDAYFFVTNHKPEQKGDSIFLYEILTLWLKRKNWKLTPHPIFLDPDKPANDQDKMLEEYNKFLCTLPSNSEVYVSIKGGTPQMITALKIQTFSISFKQHLFLEPRLNIKKLLAGEFSDCQVSSYWQSRRQQKYQVIDLLLKRWDFDGASQVLEDWRGTIQYLIDKKVTEDNISEYQKVIDSVNSALKVAIGSLNLDKTHAEAQREHLAPKLTDLIDHYDHLLNLYTQCCIFWQLDRIADFLTRMGSFYEETLHELIRGLGGEQYFDRVNYPDDWYLDTGKLLSDRVLLVNFYNLEKKINAKFRSWNYVYPMDDLYKLLGRASKANFVGALVQTYKAKDLNVCEQLIKAMKQLDYWAEKRNILIHSARGVSRQRMLEVRVDDNRLVQLREMKNQKIERSVGNSCLPEEIRYQMATIAQCTLELMGISQLSSITAEKRNYLQDPDKEPYYLYSEIRDWVIDRLNQDL
jgi:hypothetical protein